MMANILKNKLLYTFVMVGFFIFAFLLFTPTVSADGCKLNRSVNSREGYGIGLQSNAFVYVYADSGGSLVCPTEDNSPSSAATVAIAYYSKVNSSYRGDNDGIWQLFRKTAYDDSIGDYRFDNPEGFEGRENYLIINEGSSQNATEYLTLNGEQQADNVLILDPYSLSAQALDGSATNTSTNAPPSRIGDADDAQEEVVTCDTQGIVLGYIICRLLDLADATLEFADVAVIGLFEIKSEFYDNEGIRGAWSNIRNLAFIIIVPAFLVMVISTALGFEFVSAYTVKKALPRLIIATVFIAFSYEIAVFAIQATDTIAQGIQGFIYTPFNVSGDQLTLQALFNWEFTTGEQTLGNIGIGLLAAAGLKFAATGGAFILMGVLGSAAIVLLGVFLLLALRQMLIIGLVLVAPLAILGWIFPANTKLWGLWRGSFTKLLLIYPIIVFLTAVGRVFAYLIAETIFRV